MKKCLYLLTIILTICATAAFDTPTLTVMTYNSFSVSDDLIRKFEDENNVKIQFLQVGNGGEMVSRAVLTKDTPIADVIIGFDDTQLVKVLTNDILEPFDSPVLEKIPDEFKSDPENRAIPFNYGDVCINYDTAWFKENELPLPETLADLTDPVYSGLLVTEDPSASNTGMSFLLATIAEFGEDGYIDYWKKLLENGLEITPDWTTAYYTNFSASSGMGPQPMVVSYASSPAAEVIYAEEEVPEAPTASLTADGMCYRPIEFCGILKNSANSELAGKFLDAFLGKEWQEDTALQMFVYPVNSEAELPAEFVEYGATAENPIQLDPETVNEHRAEWISEWTTQILNNY